ncbi:hypothetical protein EDC01DRAFT_784744 [Geopyxis carbonaria]|nr:hypothetical protein EDC01DRAFT_784744 [Geopyxis carbonaria]
MWHAEAPNAENFLMGLDFVPINSAESVSPFSPSPPSPTSSTTSYSSTTSSTTTSSTSSEKRRAKLATFRAKRGPHPTSTNLAHACPEPDCSYTFERPGELTKHRRGQHQRPYKCTFDTCRYFSHGFQSNKDRERHLASQHNPEAPKVPCGYLNCKYETNRPDNLPKHRAAVHKIETKPSRTVMRKNPTVPKQPAKRKGRPRKHRQPSPPAGGA